jgi:hypothetical protein
MSWLTGIMKAKRPNPKVGMRMDFKPQSVEIANGEIIRVLSNDSVDIRITWSTTSMFGIGMVYLIDLNEGSWHIVREDAW